MELGTFINNKSKYTKLSVHDDSIADRQHKNMLESKVNALENSVGRLDVQLYNIHAKLDQNNQELLTHLEALAARQNREPTPPPILLTETNDDDNENANDGKAHSDDSDSDAPTDKNKKSGKNRGRLSRNKSGKIQKPYDKVSQPSKRSTYSKLLGMFLGATTVGGVFTVFMNYKDIIIDVSSNYL